MEYAVRLQIVPVQAGPRVVKSTPHGRELVEVDGFKFIRKRPAEAVAALDAPATKHASPSAPPPPCPQPAAPTPLPRTATEPLKMATPCSAVPGQAGAGVLPLQGHDDAQLHEQLLACLPPDCPPCTRTMLLVTHLLQRPFPAPAPSTPPEPATRPAAMGSHDDAGILSRAAASLGQRFCKLLTQQMDAARAMLVQARSEGASPMEAPSPYAALAPMVREASEGPGLRAALRARLAALLAEERVWEQLEQRYAAPSGGMPPAAAAAAPTSAESMAAGAAAGVELPGGAISTEPADTRAEESMSYDGVLSAAAEAAHDLMTSQVDLVCGQVTKDKVLLRQAQAAAASLHASYCMDKFRGLPHVQSPLALIRNITTMPAPTAAGIIAAASPGGTPLRVP